jgi:hypothetical protein
MTDIRIRLIKRAAIVGRLYYHMALCILAQVNPLTSKDSEESRTTQQHHAYQVCGIVAHNKDHGVASVSIRSLVIVSEVLTDYVEQQEVLSILQRIDHETGWKLAGVISNLKKRWGQENRDQPSLVAAHLLSSALPPGNGMGSNQPLERMVNGQPLPGSSTTTTPPQQIMSTSVTQTPATMAPQQMQPVVTTRPMHINPLSYADFSNPNHPYRNWYEPPSRSNPYNP